MLKFFKMNNAYIFILIFCQMAFSIGVMHLANQGYTENSKYAAKIQNNSESIKVMAIDLFGRTTSYWKIQQLEEKAKQGDLNAQIALAEIYFRGDQTGRDIDKSLKWFTKAAAKGDNYSKKMVRVITNDKIMIKT